MKELIERGALRESRCTVTMIFSSRSHYTPDAFREKLFDTFVEVFHVPTGRLVTSQRLPQHFVGVDSDGYVFSYEEDEEGNPRYAMWRLAVRVPN